MKRASAKKPTCSKPNRLAKGFVQTGGLLGGRIRAATQSRGFAETRLLTQWREIAGEAIASIARPVKVAYGRQGFGATLTLLTNGANAPIVQAESAKIRERVNSVYGYAAISVVRVTQTSETGFAEPQAEFRRAAPGKPAKDGDPPRMDADLGKAVNDIADPSLRSALAALGDNILTRNNNRPA